MSTLIGRFHVQTSVLDSALSKEMVPIVAHVTMSREDNVLRCLSQMTRCQEDVCCPTVLRFS